MDNLNLTLFIWLLGRGRGWDHRRGVQDFRVKMEVKGVSVEEVR